MSAPPDPLEAMPARGSALARRLLAQPRAVLGLALLAALFLLAFAGPQLARWDWQQTDFTALREPPSAEHWFGTTASGRDVFALTLRGMQKSLLIGLSVAVLSTGLAALVGMVAGYAGGWADRVLMWAADLLLVLPAFLVLAVLDPALGSAWPLLVLVLAAFMWMVTARMVRQTTISLKEREFVLAARCMGVSPARVLARHVLPNLGSLLIIDGTLHVSVAVIAESGLSYFGFGVHPPDSSLGTVIAEGAAAATTFPWLFGFAAGLLVLLVLAVNLVGDGLRDALDPAGGGGVR
ncbi:peptide/nickel transport system permease protein [Actinomadura cellulosilytica]|uniref:Oligopeptide transport system permease protein OppC n=2 Tax=Thermomonospora cellulosilytica TaxID=1411118 RepID=A0A7W3RBI6_9ACTN|nr:peptide/nickel transport system permease protein [Thermomonospora cellulosilytica]